MTQNETTNDKTEQEAEAEEEEEVPEMTEEEWDELRADLQGRYQFYVMNPAYEKGVNYSLWVQEDDYEYPVMNSNSGGFVTFNSRHKTIGDGIVPTEEFLSLVGYGFHEAMCFMPPIYFQDDDFERLYQNIYDGKPREYEVWAAHVLVRYFTGSGELMPELEPLAEWANKHTKFGMPILGEEADQRGEDA